MKIGQQYNPLMKFFFVVVLFQMCSMVSADTIVTAPNGVTDFFGNQNGVADAGDASGLLFDEARAGGGDTAAQVNFTPSRFLSSVAGTNDNWAAGLATGTPGTIEFTGLGFALRGGTTATEASATIIYLGADGAVGGGDDETVGMVTDNLNFAATSEYAWSFSNPLQFQWDGMNNRFRFELSGTNGNLRFKQRPVNESPSGQGGLTLSVGGSFTAIPEPSSMLVLGIAALPIALRRKK